MFFSHLWFLWLTFELDTIHMCLAFMFRNTNCGFFRSLCLFIQCAVVISAQSAKLMCIWVFYMIKYVQQITLSANISTHLHYSKWIHLICISVSNVQTSFKMCMFFFVKQIEFAQFFSSLFPIQLSSTKSKTVRLR